MSLARILLVGILAVACILILAQAIIFAAPYIAALIVALTIGRFIYKRLGAPSSDE